MKYAIIHSGGKQYRTSEGDIIEIEHLPGVKDQKITFSEVLLYSNDGSTQIGTPFISGILVDGVIIDHFKGNKLRVAKFKAKSRYRRVMGHRQSLTRVKIENISDGSEKDTSDHNIKVASKQHEKKPAENK